MVRSESVIWKCQIEAQGVNRQAFLLLRSSSQWFGRDVRLFHSVKIFCLQLHYCLDVTCKVDWELKSNHSLWLQYSLLVGSTVTKMRIPQAFQKCLWLFTRSCLQSYYLRCKWLTKVQYCVPWKPWMERNGGGGGGIYFRFIFPSLLHAHTPVWNLYSNLL